MKALGFVEVTGVVAAVDALDIMCKTANVELVTWERRLGGRLVTVIIEGTVSDVSQAIESAKAKCVSEVKASNVIANPHSETQRLVELSASRIRKKNAPKTEEAPVEAQAETAGEPAEEAPKKKTARKPKTTK